MANNPYITANEIIGARQPRVINDVGSNPANKIDVKTSKGMAQPITYPPDLGKYRFVILESEVDITYNLDFQQMFVLPLPYGMTEAHTTHYDANFNMADAAVKTGSTIANSLDRNNNNANQGQGVGGAIGNGIGGIGSILGSATGLHLNQMKWVTLNNPAFNTHKFAWKFSPKTYQESKTVREIVYKLKNGMLVNKIGYGGSGQLFGFPKIYSMFYMPNMQFLYKFKPCVLQHIEIDYQGANPAPAFFRDQTLNEPGEFDMNSNTAGPMNATLSPNQLGRGMGLNVTGDVSYSPPESIVLHTTWLELEVWTQEDFNGKMTTSDPFDGYSWYGAK